MQNLLKLYIWISLVCISFISMNPNAQCNTNISICTSGVAGPFTFAPASPNPSSCLQFVNGQAAANYAYIVLYITQAGELNLLIDGNQVSGCLDVSIFDITGQADPCASLGIGTEIGCNFASSCDGCNEFGSNFPCASEVPAPTVNVGDVLMILVEDWDGIMTNFTLELSNAPGSAQTGPPPADIDPVAQFCDTDAPFQLSGATGGGTWSGTGVSTTGMFDPAAAGVGTFTITHNIGSFPCEATDQVDITVLNCSNACSMDFISASPGSCEPADNLFDVIGTVEFSSPPATGQLIVEDCNGNQSSYNAPFTSPHAYSIEHIVSDSTANCSVTAYFTDDPGCSITSASYDHPPSCICSVDAGPDQSVCDGEQVILAGSLSLDYTWDNGVTDGVAFTPPVGTTTYTVTGTNGNGCQSTDQVDVIVHPIPAVNAGIDLIICDGEEAILTGSGANYYVWDNGVIDGVPFVPTIGTTTYTVTGDSNGCTSTDQMDVTVIGTVSLSFTADVLTGCEPLAVEFTNTSGAALDHCVWMFGDGSSTSGCVSVNNVYQDAGLYDVTLIGTDVNGCTATQTYTDYIYVESKPEINFYPSSWAMSLISTSVDFFNLTQGAVSYNWNFGDNMGGSTEESPSYTYPSDIANSYTVQLIAQSALGCIDSATIVISTYEDLIFYVPNSFTPDGDEFNQSFQPIFSSGYDPSDYSLLIFNRWGEVVFESHDVNFGWDGTYNGNTVMSGTYNWTIEVKTVASDERVYVNGHVNVIK